MIASKVDRPVDQEIATDFLRQSGIRVIAASLRRFWMLSVRAFTSIALSAGWALANQLPVPTEIVELFDEVAQLQAALKIAESVERLRTAIAAAEEARIEPARLADFLTPPSKWLSEGDPAAAIPFLRLRLKLRQQQTPPDDVARGQVSGRSS